jgi:hypothetical protein
MLHTVDPQTTTELRAEQPYHYVVAAQPPSNGMATAGGVLGIVGFTLGWIPLIGWVFGFVLGILAIVFSSVGMARAGKLPGANGRGLAIAGLVLGIVIVVLKMIPALTFW